MNKLWAISVCLGGAWYVIGTKDQAHQRHDADDILQALSKSLRLIWIRVVQWKGEPGSS